MINNEQKAETTSSSGNSAKPFVIGRFKLSCKVSAGVSKGGYYHLPILFIGWGRNGFGISIAGIYFGVAW
jgi:hypothetical protein